MRLDFVACRDGLRLAVRRWGNWSGHSIPLLCLPGLSRNGADFDSLAAAVAPRPIVALDLLGRGMADRVDDPRRYAPGALVSDIRDVTAALGLHHCVLIGTSFGGLLAMALAVSQPGLPAAAILNDIGPGIAAAGGTSAGASIWLEVVGNPPAPADWGEAVAYLQAVMPDLSIETPHGWQQLAEATFAGSGNGGLKAQWDPAIVSPLKGDAERPDIWAMFRALASHPILAVRGGASLVLTAEGLAQMQDAAPAMRSVTLPGIGHAPTLTEPAALSAIRLFLGEIDRLHAERRDAYPSASAGIEQG